MPNNPAASYEASNDRGMNSISSNYSVQHTTMQFFANPVVHEILSDCFFKIQYEEFVDIYNKAGFPKPEFDGDFFLTVETSDPKLNRLVLKVELSRFLFNNLESPSFQSGFENFIPLLNNRKELFIENRMMGILICNEMNRLNLLINRGLYSPELEIDIPRINMVFGKAYVTNVSIDELFKRNLSIFMHIF